MAGNLTASKTLGGSNPSDSLTGGATGYDYGLSQAGVATPPTNAYYLVHDGAALITQLAVNVQLMSGTYGGAYSAAADLAKLISHGDGGYGLQLDLVWNDAAAFTTYETVRTGVGASFATRITIPTTAMAYNNAGTLQAPVTPVAGELGASGNSTLGDTIRLWSRYVAPSGESQVGKRQFDVYYSFNFTT